MASVFSYPVALNVRGRTCVVVGGGTVASRKVRALLDSGAKVLVIAPDLSDELVTLTLAGQITHFADAFRSDLLPPDALLLIAATDKPSVNAAVKRAGEERRILVNLAAPGDDDTDDGDFATMATVKRGDLLVSLTTGGAGPALTARLRREFETQFGPEWSEYVALLAEMRIRAKMDFSDPTERAVALRDLASHDKIREYLKAGDTDAARQEALSCL